MAGLLEGIRVWVEQIIGSLGYPGLALVMFLESIFPPIPSEVIMPFAGFLAGRGELDALGVVVAGTLGSLGGALALYGVGRWAEDHLVLSFVRRYGRIFLLSEADWLSALHVFDRHGGRMVLLGRLVPVIRSLISIPAGMDHLPLGRFLALTALGSAAWNAALTAAGVLLGERWEQVIDWVHEYEIVVLVAGLGFGLWLGGRLLRGWRRSRAGAKEKESA